MAIADVYVFKQTLENGFINQMTREEMISDYLSWAQNSLTPDEITQFTQARDRHQAAREQGLPADPEAQSFFERYCLERQVERVMHDVIYKSLYRQIQQGIQFFKKTPYDEDFIERTDLDIDAVAKILSFFINDLTTEDQMSYQRAVTDNYQIQSEFAGNAADMPVTSEFDAIWQEFLNESWLYEAQGDVILDSPETYDYLPEDLPVNDVEVVSGEGDLTGPGTAYDDPTTPV